MAELHTALVAALSAFTVTSVARTAGVSRTAVYKALKTGKASASLLLRLEAAVRLLARGTTARANNLWLRRYAEELLSGGRPYMRGPLPDTQLGKACTEFIKARNALKREVNK